MAPWQGVVYLQVGRGIVLLPYGNAHGATHATCLVAHAC